MGDLTAMSTRPVCAIDQINMRLHELSGRYKARELLLKVGHCAEMAICCHVPDRQLPSTVNGVKVERTRKFPGWEVYANGCEVE